MRTSGWMAGVILLAGCGSGTAVAPAGQGAGVVPSATASSSTPSAAELDTRMRKALRQAVTGAFSQRASLEVGDGTVTQVLEGRYDLGARRWRGTSRFENDSPTVLAQEPDIEKPVFRFIGVRSRGYMTAPGWPKRIRGRWLRIDAEDLANADATAAVLASSGQPQAIATLLAMTPVAVRPASTGYALTGSVPSGVALAILGLNTVLLKEGVDVAGLPGRAKIEVLVGTDGLPTSLRIEGKTLATNAPLTAIVKQALPLKTATVTFNGFREPAGIVVPRGHDVLDPSEMTP